MSEKIRSYAVIAVSVIFISVFAVALLFRGDAGERGFIEAERRYAASPPAFSDIFDSDFSRRLESRLLDVFPLRKSFRKASAAFSYNILFAGDVNGYYLCDNGIAEVISPLDTENAKNTGMTFGRIRESLFPDSDRYYLSVIPDKSFYTASAVKLDCDELTAKLLEYLPEGFGYIDLTESLGLYSYYATDLHWNQTKIYPAALEISRALDVAISPAESYTMNCAGYFEGGFAGASALPGIPHEKLCFLENDVTANAVVQYSDGSSGSLYELSAFENSSDKYDIFLRGEMLSESRANFFTVIENPLCETRRELVIFRDSFARALVPLLLGGYSKITLIDLRCSTALYDGYSEYLDFPENTDYLFLLSARVLNSTRIN